MHQHHKNILIGLGLAVIATLVMAYAAPAHSSEYDANGNVVIGGRPEGCPHAYCGCGLRKYLGIEDVRLNLAWNWAKLFPRTHPKPGAAAVRRHHVFLLEEHLHGNVWRVRDYNSGNHKSRIHPRSIAGYVIVDPTQRVGYAQ